MTLAATSFPETFPHLLMWMWARRMFILIGFACGLVVGAILLVSLKPHYEASMIVAPVSEDQLRAHFVEGKVVTSPGRDVQIPLGSPNFIRFEQSLRGASVARLLFDMTSVRSKLAEDTLLRWGKREFATPEDVMVYVSRAVTIDPMGVTASRRIVYRHPDPVFAARMLKLMRKVDDQIIRVSVRNQTDEKIQWLKSELKKTLNPDHRAALTELLMMEERRLMLLSLDAPFAVEVIEEPSVLPRPVVPNATLLFTIFPMMGALCAMVFVMVRERGFSR